MTRMPDTLLFTEARPAAARVESIDLVRGVVMILMALDHVRDYLHFDSLLFSPTDLSRTTPALFATRLVTHLCAPAFIFLAGVSAHFAASRRTGREASLFLLTRGAWLVLLQLTVVRFGWNFDPAFHFNSSNILSTIGFSMIALAGLVHLPRRALFVAALAMVFGHNALDGIAFRSGGADVLWTFLHARKLYTLSHGDSFLFLYPLIPWVAVMALGYCAGRLFDPDFSAAARKSLLLSSGLAAVAAFLIVRCLNVYGDPVPWQAEADLSTTVMSFFNLEKYPPSLLYLCLTLGVTMTLLGLVEGRRMPKPIVTFGRAALFFYVVHIYLVHAAAMLACVAGGFPWQSMIFAGHQSQSVLKGQFGFSLARTYVIWACIVVLLYLFCAHWNAFKLRNRERWWVSYV